MTSMEFKRCQKIPGWWRRAVRSSTTYNPTVLCSVPPHSRLASRAGLATVAQRGRTRAEPGGRRDGVDFEGCFDVELGSGAAEVPASACRPQLGVGRAGIDPMAEEIRRSRTQKAAHRLTKSSRRTGAAVIMAFALQRAWPFWAQSSTWVAPAAQLNR